MDSKYANALSAFFDGEVVDSELLAESLAQPGALALLSEFAAIRSQIEGDDSRPRPEIYDMIPSKLRLMRSRRRWALCLWKFALASGLSVVIASVSFEVGSILQQRRSAPPEHQVRGIAARVDQSQAPPRAEPCTPLLTTAPIAIAAKPPSGGPPAAVLRLHFDDWRQSNLVAEEPLQR